MNTQNKQEAAEGAFFEELKDTFFFQVHRVQKTMFRHANRLMQESKIDLQVEQFPVLMTVHAHGSLSQKEIAGITQRDKSSIQRSVTALEKKGLLIVNQDSGDKRRSIVSMTDEGNALAIKTKHILRKADEATFAGLSETERQQAIQSVREIADKLDKL